MRHFAVAIGFGVCSIAAPDGSAVEQSYAAEGTYQAPTRWSNFNRPSKPIRSTTAKSTSGKPFDAMIQTVAAQQAVEALPAPRAEWTGPVPEVEAAPAMRPAVPAMEIPHAVPSAP